MKEYAARDIERDFGQVAEAAQASPVRVVGPGDRAVVVMSDERYRAFRSAAWDRLAATMDEIGGHAARQGLTDEILAELLADE